MPRGRRGCCTTQWWLTCRARTTTRSRWARRRGRSRRCGGFWGETEAGHLAGVGAAERLWAGREDEARVAGSTAWDGRVGWVSAQDALGASHGGGQQRCGESAGGRFRLWRRFLEADR